MSVPRGSQPPPRRGPGSRGPSARVAALRSFLGIGVLSALVLTGYHYVQEATARVASRGGDLTMTRALDDSLGSRLRRTFSLLSSGGYSLGALENLVRADNEVFRDYLDPDRIDHGAMFKASLSEVERLVPEVLLRLSPDEKRLRVDVGSYRTELSLQEIRSFSAMEAELRRVVAILEEHLDPEEHDLQAIEYALINGMLSTLDPHSVFMPPEVASRFEEDNEGEFGGLGISVEMEKGQLSVQYPLEDTPAFRAGIKAGDKIIAIDGEGTLNMDLNEAVDKMRGAPRSSVTITIDRPEFSSPRDFTIVRDRIRPTQVWGKLLEGDVLYIRIDQFHEKVKEQLDEVLESMGTQAPGGLKGIVLDMRDNPGGYLDVAIEVSDRFLAEGDIVATVGRNGTHRDVKSASASGVDVTVPISVLMSGNSASAAEIVAGALRNNERAVIIGERSFGKGSVQNQYPFSGRGEENAKLKLTVQRYLTPGDHSIQNVGIPADIQLDRSVVYPPRSIPALEEAGAADHMSGPRISLFYRDRVLREADLAGHLANQSEVADPLYTVRYLSPDPDEDAPRTDRKDVTRDFEVLFARDVLLATRGTRRADLLRDAAGVIASRQKSEQAKIEAAFRAQGLDWTACANPASADVRMELKLAEGKGLRAGELQPVALAVTNLGSAPLCRIVARSESGNDNLDDLEYYFGRINPGQTRTYTTKVRMSEAYPSEVSGIDLELMDDARVVLAKDHLTANTEGYALPRYAWAWSAHDKEGGDGDGLIEVGEVVTLAVEVTNVGEGAGGEVTLDLKKGTGLGKSVELVSKKGSFLLEGLAPGAKAQGTLQLRVVAPPPEGKVPLVLRVHEDERFDYASIVKAGFVGYYTQEESISLPMGAPVTGQRRETPAIELTRAPGLTSDVVDVTVSGVATDDVGVRDVILYHGTRKIAYAEGGSAGVKRVPFSAQTTLDEGNNHIVVLVRDQDGFTTTRSVNVYRAPSAASALAPTVTPKQP